MERATLSNVFAKDSFTPAALQQFMSLLASQQSYLERFRAVATDEQIGLLDTLLQSPVMGEVSKLEQVALEKMAQGGFGVDPEQWFAVSTKKIDLLKQGEDQLYQQLFEGVAQMQISSQHNFWWGTLAVLVCLLLTCLISWKVLRDLHLGFVALHRTRGTIRSPPHETPRVVLGKDLRQQPHQIAVRDSPAQCVEQFQRSGAFAELSREREQGPAVCFGVVAVQPARIERQHVVQRDATEIIGL